MFENAMMERGGGRNTAWAATAMTGQAALLALAMSVPLFYPDALNVRQFVPVFIFPGTRTADSRPRPTPGVSAATGTARLTTRTFVEPSRVPEGVAHIIEPVGETVLPSGGGGPFNLAFTGSSEGNLIAPMPVFKAAPPPKEPAASAEDVKPIPRIKVGGYVQAAKLTRKVMPVYPPLARQARIAGTVELLGIIGADGTVRELQVVRGHPLLVQAALDAVRQWLYEPTLLNGNPVEVVAPVQVNFVLGN